MAQQVALDQQDIAMVALDLVDRDGLDALSMRTLASRLGVRASALYWHFGDKAELISLMARAFYVDAIKAAADAPTWQEWLLAFGHAFRGALLAHRDSARLCALASPDRASARTAAELMAEPLVMLGLDRATALSRQASVISLALGWAVYEQSNTLHDHLARMIGFDESFASGLRAMIVGFAVPQVNATATPSG